MSLREVNVCRVRAVRGVYGCVRHDPGVTNLFVAAEWILYHFNCSPLWTLLSIVLAYALLRCSLLGYQRWTRTPASAGDRYSDPFVTLCHLVTLCDTLWQCNTVTGGVLRQHRVVTGHLAPCGGSSGVRAATSDCSLPDTGTRTFHHSPSLSRSEWILSGKYKVQATMDEWKTLIVTVDSIWKLGICHCWNILRVGLQ